MNCECYSEARPTIWLCPHHRYWKDGREYTSVSKVRKAVMPEDYSRVDAIVLKTANLRGSFVDQYFSDFIDNDRPMMPLREVREMIEPRFPEDGKKHAEKTIKMIAMLLDWWVDRDYEWALAQQICYSEADGIAGTKDIDTPGLILDIKCVSKLYPNYALQLGAYSEYSGGKDVAIIHITDRKVKLVPYDAANCRRQWREAVEEFNKLACD